MGLSQDQVARLMAGLKTTQKAKIAGIEPTRETKQIAKFVDSQSMTSNVVETKPTPAAIRGDVSYPGAPKTLEESGLAAAGFNFDDSQVVALKELTQGFHVALIGAAGTGKTTMVKHAMAQLIYGSDNVAKPIGVRQLAEDQGPSIAICAFTGIATQVVKEMLPTWLHPACKTIHQLLEYKPTDEEGAMFVPTRNELRKLDHDLIVIDEASMLGLDLWHNLVDALRPHTRVILIGDLNQLKPVADATMFAYALSAGIDRKDGWSIAQLTTIHRQKEPAANKIIDAAHAILNGNRPTFDDPNKDPAWRFIGMELPVAAATAHEKIVAAIKFMMSLPTPDNAERPLFDPYQDLLLTAGNGEDENNSASYVQQIPLNETLSRIIEPPSEEHPIYIVDAGRATRKFAVGHRVMATKNESPAMKDRVTNGLTGRIVLIESNKNWNGNRSMFGTEKEVIEWRRAQGEALRRRLESNGKSEAEEVFGAFDMARMNTETFAASEKGDRQASHRITVKFKNGATRTYSTAADVEGLRLAYAITVHKAQGSQADTVIIVVHQAVKAQLNREWFYTGVTRARRRVIVLYTQMGLATAVSRQQIFGKDLKEKVERYRATMDSGRAFVRLRAHYVAPKVDSTTEGEVA